MALVIITSSLKINGHYQAYIHKTTYDREMQWKTIYTKQNIREKCKSCKRSRLTQHHHLCMYPSYEHHCLPAYQQASRHWNGKACKEWNLLCFPTALLLYTHLLQLTKKKKGHALNTHFSSWPKSKPTLLHDQLLEKHHTLSEHC